MSESRPISSPGISNSSPMSAGISPAHELTASYNPLDSSPSAVAGAAAAAILAPPQQNFSTAPSSPASRSILGTSANNNNNNNNNTALSSSARSGSEAGGGRRRKKKVPPPPQAHAEPRNADEAEVRMMWNRIAALPGNGRMTTPAEGTMTYQGASIAIDGGLHNTLTVAAQTQPLVMPMPNLVHLARGPLALFIAEGCHPKIGWIKDELMLPSQIHGIKDEDPAAARARRGTGAGSTGRRAGMNASAAASATLRGASDGAVDDGDSLSNSTRPGQGFRSGFSVGPSGERMMDPVDVISALHPPVSSNPQSNNLSPSSASLQGAAAGGNINILNFNANRAQSPLLQSTASAVSAAPTVYPVPPAGAFRAVPRAQQDGTSALENERHLEECTQWMLDLATAVANERHQFAQTKTTLGEDIKKLQRTRAKQQDRHDSERKRAQQGQKAATILRDDDLQRLEMQRPKVLEQLSERRRVLRELTDVTVAVEKAESAATDRQLVEEKALTDKRNRLEELLRKKLSNAVDQMAQLSEAQRKARESSTVEDFARLAGELTEQERKMRDLNSASSRLQSRIASLRRELSLETQRGQMLQEKQDGYHTAISTLVRRLEDVERKYAAQSQRELKGVSTSAVAFAKSESGANNKSSAPASDLTVDVNQQLPRVIDQQYSVILQLRADLVRVRQEVAQATALLKEERKNLAQVANPSSQPILPRQPRPPAATSSSSTDAIMQKQFASTASSSSVSSSSTQQPQLPGDIKENEAAFLRHTIFEALHDADENLAALVRKNQQLLSSTAPASAASAALPAVYPTLELLDPQQRLDVFKFVVRRINTKLLNPLQGPDLSERSGT